MNKAYFRIEWLVNNRSTVTQITEAEYNAHRNDPVDKSKPWTEYCVRNAGPLAVWK